MPAPLALTLMGVAALVAFTGGTIQAILAYRAEKNRVRGIHKALNSVGKPVVSASQRRSGTWVPHSSSSDTAPAPARPRPTYPGEGDGSPPPPFQDDLDDEDLLQLRYFRRVIKAELEQDRHKSFWPSFWVGVLINCVTSALFFVLGLLVAQQH